MKTLNYLIIAPFLFISCHPKVKENKEANPNKLALSENVAQDRPGIQTLGPNEINDTVPANGISITFPEFKVLIDSIENWDEKKDIVELQKDKVKIPVSYWEPSSTLRILNSKFDKIEIYQRFENSITITNEGPHCDLTSWVSFISEWKKLDSNGKFQFKVNVISEEESQQFVPVELNEFKEAVQTHCGDDWFELIKNIKSINEYPCEIGTSKIELKIILRNGESQSSIEKTIEFEIAMGC